MIHQSPYRRWIYVLKNMEALNRLPWAAQNSVFERLQHIADISALSKEERLKYDEAIKKYRDTLCVMEGAEMKGRAEGEHAKAVKIAKNLKTMGLSKQDIIKATGLTLNDFDNIR